MLCEGEGENPNLCYVNVISISLEKIDSYHPRTLKIHIHPCT